MTERLNNPKQFFLSDDELEMVKFIMQARGENNFSRLMRLLIKEEHWRQTEGKQDVEELIKKELDRRMPDLELKVVNALMSRFENKD